MSTTPAPGRVPASTDVRVDALELEELRATAAAVDRSQAVVELGLDGTVLRANGIFLAATGYAASEVVGQQHRMFWEPADLGSSAYDDLWAELRSGAFHSGEHRRVAKDGRPLWFRTSYTPVLDAEGRPAKVVELALDVTAAKRAEAEVTGRWPRSTAPRPSSSSPSTAPC